jgi:thiamine pyrophosphokinase
MQTYALVGAVDFNSEHFLSQSFDHIIAVDKGFAYLEKLGIMPDMVLGDFDSLGYIPPHVQTKVYPAQKDKSDIELALEYALAQGADTVFIYGCLAKRLDFTYAVLQMICRFSEAGQRVFGIGDNFAVLSLVGEARSSISFSKEAQGTISVFAHKNEVQGVSEVGLEYTLDKVVLTNTRPLGVSNSFAGVPSCISVEKGTLLVFCPLNALAAVEHF